MKKVIALMALCLIGMTAFSQSGKPEQFFSFEAFYAPSKYIYVGDNELIDDKDADFKEYGLGISANQPLSSSINLYLNWGVGFLFSAYEWKSEPFDFMGYQKQTELSYLYFSWMVKGNVGYLIEIPNTSVGIYPYGGLFVRWHIGGKEYYKYPYYDPEDNTIYEKTDKTSLFVKSANNPNPWNMMELGVNFGAKVYLGKFMLGLTYAKTFTDLAEDTRVQELRLSAGLKF